MRRLVPTVRDWRDLLALRSRGNLRRLAGRLGLISPEQQLAALEAEIPEILRLRAVVAPPRS